MPIIRRAIVVLGLLAAIATPASAQGPVGEVAAAAQVDAIFGQWARVDSPGCAVGVGRAGETIMSRGYGMADLEHDIPNTPGTIFEAGSVSKQFTATAIVLLAQQGKLSVEDDVRRFLPELPDYGAPITIRHLLTHTSGLRDWGSILEAEGWPRGTRITTHADVLDIVTRQKAINFPPGSEYLYSNTGYNLLVMIVDRVAGEPFTEFTRKNIFEPLRMTQTRWRDDFSRIVKGRALAYAKTGTGAQLEMPFENAYGHGGLLTTVGDLLLWNENFVHGRVGGAVLTQELQRQARLTSGRLIAYAEGLVVGRYRGVVEVSHSGGTGGYRAYLSRYPEKRLSVAVLCNVAQANPTALARQVADVFLGLPTTPSSSGPATTVSISPDRLAAKAGLYRSRRTHEPMRLVVQDGSLRRETSVLTAVSSSRFRLADGGEVEFIEQRSPSGAAMRLTVDGDMVEFDRVPEVRPTPAQLAEYEGEYRSDEAKAVYAAVVVDGTLVLRRRPATTLSLSPSYADTFMSRSGWLVRFIRDGEGRVAFMSLGMSRVRDLRFVRVSPDRPPSASEY